ncbi:MAG: carotenoid biosynthesis protein [Draconibacterium sp.]
MSLYFILLLSSIAVPLFLSFDKRLQFFKRWKYVLPSIFSVAAVYIFFDVLFTEKGVWGFNLKYISGFHLFGLPVEEILFFFAIPYASIFLHDAFVEYFPEVKIGKRLTLYLTILLIILSVIIIVFNSDKTYTSYIFIKVLIVLMLSLFDESETIRSFYITFLIILVPFLIVNGILTGSGIDSEVVWYNNSENLRIRIFTIPVEDIGYAFSMILFNLLLMNQFKKIKWVSLKSKLEIQLKFLKRNVKYVKLFFVIFFGVGVLGLATPATFLLFRKLIPVALLLSAAGLLVYHGKVNRKTLFAFGIIYLISFFVELAGVNTGFIFGDYFYGGSLGIKLINTPLLIGLNWLMLVYLTESVSVKLISNRYVQVPVSASLMVAYDIVLEKVAPELDMWYWTGSKVPLNNYIAWFLLAVLLVLIFRSFNVKTSVSLAPFLFLCQSVFFLTLLIWFNLSI